jgi:putative membrane protein
MSSLPSRGAVLPPARTPPALILLMCFVAACLLWSGLDPFDRTTWWLEIMPIFAVMPLLWFTRVRFPLTTLLYIGIGLHAGGLLVGAAYSFPRVPLGAHLAEWFHLSRNPYDRIGHFVQGFVPAIAAREILLRGRHVTGPRMAAFLVVCVVMTFSATYELVEWAAAVTIGAGADDFLGMQGDPWDAQADMLCAFVGAVAMLLTLPRVHDRQMRALAGTPKPLRRDGARPF